MNNEEIVPDATLNLSISLKKDGENRRFKLSSEFLPDGIMAMDWAELVMYTWRVMGKLIKDIWQQIKIPTSQFIEMFMGEVESTAYESKDSDGGTDEYLASDNNEEWKSTQPSE